MGVFAHDVLQVRERSSLFRTLRALIVSPVRTTVDLANDRRFHGHGLILILTLALNAVMAKALQAAMETRVPETKTSFADSLISSGKFGPVAQFLIKIFAEYTDNLEDIMYLVWLFLTFAYGYRAFKKRAPTEKSPRAYLKLVVLAFLIGTIIGIIGNLPLLAGFLRIISLDTALVVWGTAAVICFIATIYYWFRISTLFWNITNGAVLRAGLVSGLQAILTLLGIVVAIGIIFGSIMALMNGPA
jgi:hypothetical protein